MRLCTYVDANGTFDYDRYRQIQEKGNLRKIESVWADENVIRALSRFAVANLDTLKFGLCHGTRRGLEQEWFSRYTGANFLGTEISPTAHEFPNTIQWDFHEVKDEWLGNVDVIYSNSWDHTYDPQLCFTNWMRCLRPGGFCFLEHTRAHWDDQTSALDPFGISLPELLLLLTEIGKGSFFVRTILSDFSLSKQMSSRLTTIFNRAGDVSPQQPSVNVVVVERARRDLIPHGQSSESAACDQVLQDPSPLLSDDHPGRDPSLIPPSNIVVGDPASGPRSTAWSSTKFNAFTDEQLLEAFQGTSSVAKHLLIFYSLVVGVNAQIVLDLGLGNSTRAARAAVRSTGGVVYSCACNNDRCDKYESVQATDWKVFCPPEREMMEFVPGPIDIAFHDGSREHNVVRDELVALFPKMRQFGLVCVHDTQHPRYTLLEAVHEAVRQVESTQKISFVTLPFGCGLTILRVETSDHPPIEPAGKHKGDRVVTALRSLEMETAVDSLR